MVDIQEKVDLLKVAEQVIARARHYDSTADHFELTVAGKLDPQELQALDALAASRNMIWLHSTIDRVLNFTFVRYQRPLGKTPIADHAG